MQRAASLFSLLLFITIIILALSNNPVEAEWILLQHPQSGALSVVDTTNGNISRVNTLSRVNGSFLTVSTNGEWFYVLRNQDMLQGVNFFTGQIQHVFQSLYSLDSPYSISPDRGVLFYQENGIVQRFDMNTTTVKSLNNIPMDTIEEGLTTMSWLEGNDYIYVWSEGTILYRISRDGEKVDAYDIFQRTASLDGNWGWYWEDGQYYVRNLVTSADFKVPSIESYFPHIGGWTSNNSLIVRYTYVNDIDFHRDIQHIPTILLAFREGNWTTISEGKVALDRDPGQFSSISPTLAHYLYFEDDDRLYIMDLKTESVAPIGEASQFYYWNESGDWVAYIQQINLNILTIFRYDVKSHANTKLYTLNRNGHNFGFETVPGTDFLLLNRLADDGPGDILIDVKSGQRIVLEPGLEVVSLWNPPSLPTPRYMLHLVIGLLLPTISLTLPLVWRMQQNVP